MFNVNSVSYSGQKLSSMLMVVLLTASPLLLAQTPPSAPKKSFIPLPTPDDFSSDKEQNKDKQNSFGDSTTAAPISESSTVLPVTLKPTNTVPATDKKINSDAAINRIRKHGKAQKIYSWTDKDGKIYVTNTPPPDIVGDTTGKIDPTLITITGQETTVITSYQDQLKALEEEKSKAKETELKDLEDRQIEAQKKIQCDQLKSRMNLYSSDRKIAQVGSDGKDRIVSSQQRQGTLSTLQSGYQTLCR